MSASRDIHDVFAHLKLQRKTIPLLVLLIFQICAALPARAAQPPAHAPSSYQPSPENVIAPIRRTENNRFDFSTIAQLATIGRRTGVANILGINFSGFFAWWLWRTIYLSKLPRFEKKLRVALDWTLDLIFSKDLVQFLDIRAPMVSLPKAHPSQKSKTVQPGLTQPVR